MTEYGYSAVGGPENLDCSNLDDPTPEETDLQRGILEGSAKDRLDPEDLAELQRIEYSEYMRLRKAEDHIRVSKGITGLDGRIAWLNSLGYEGVNVPDHPKSLSFRDAVRAGYARNVHCMFLKEVKNLGRIADDSRKYLEKTGFFKKRNN